VASALDVLAHDVTVDAQRAEGAGSAGLTDPSQGQSGNEVECQYCKKTYKKRGLTASPPEQMQGQTEAIVD
jgi:hypothetical protein